MRVVLIAIYLVVVAGAATVRPSHPPLRHTSPAQPSDSSRYPEPTNSSPAQPSDTSRYPEPTNSSPAQPSASTQFPSQQCGQTPIKPNLSVALKTSNAVVGGQPVIPNSWPWTVAICYMDWFGNCEYQGAGAIISDRYILTTATAVSSSDSNKPKQWRVQTGVNDQKNKGEPTEQVVTVLEISKHFQFKGGAENNIAMIHLEKPLRFDQFTQPVCLPASDTGMIEPGRSQWYTGWGFTSDSQSPASSLQQALLAVKPLSDCAKYYEEEIFADEICAGTSQATTCMGDAGGPLVQQKTVNSPWFLYGISSFHSKNCEAVGFFSRIYNYCPWIKVMTGVACV